jgi:hypothetical protein
MEGMEGMGEMEGAAETGLIGEAAEAG